MNVQDFIAFSSQDHVRQGGLVPGYMSGSATPSRPRRLRRAADRPQFAAKGRFRPLCRAAVGLAVHGAAGEQPALVALSHSPDGQALGPLQAHRSGLIRTAPMAREESDLPIGQLRWGPIPIPDETLTFVRGLRTMTTAGDAETRTGMAAHVLLVTASMRNEYFFNADGELLIVAQENRLRFRTEFGVIEIEPGEICVIQRGMIFKVELINGPARALCVRKLRWRFRAAVSRTDRRQLPRQSARLSHPSCRI